MSKDSIEAFRLALPAGINAAKFRHDFLHELIFKRDMERFGEVVFVLSLLCGADIGIVCHVVFDGLPDAMPYCAAGNGESRIHLRDELLEWLHVFF